MSCCFETWVVLEVKSETAFHTQRARKDQKKRQSTLDRLEVDFISKGTYRWLFLSGCMTGRSLNPSARILKVYREALTGFSHIFSPGGLNHTLLSQVCILVIPSGNSRWSVHSMDRRGRKEPLTSQVQLTGQPAVSYPLNDDLLPRVLTLLFYSISQYCAVCYSQHKTTHNSSTNQKKQ